MNWKLIEEDCILPDDFFDVEDYTDVEQARAGWINRKNILLIY
jgi:hypothetical protein